MHLASLPRALPRSAGTRAATAVAVAGAGAALGLAGPGNPLAGALTLVFLAVAPAVAVAGLVGGDRITRIVSGIAGVVAVNGAVAMAMLAFGVWSPRGGVAAVAVISALGIMARLGNGRRGTARGASRGHPPH